MKGSEINPVFVAQFTVSGIAKQIFWNYRLSILNAFIHFGYTFMCKPILGRDNVKLRKTVCRAIVFSPKIKTVKIGEMLHSKIVRRAFFSAEMKNQAV